MRLRLRSFLLTSALTFAPAVASATTISGLYVDGGAGYNEVQDQHVHANSPADGPAAQKFTINHGTGYIGFGAIGYGFGNGLRVEAEGLYNSSEDNYTQNVEEKPQEIPIQQIYNKWDVKGFGENKVVVVLPFNDHRSAEQASQGLQQGLDYDDITPSRTNCTSTYSWCGAFGGAPVIVIQKIDNLPDWAAPQTISPKDNPTNIDWSDGGYQNSYTGETMVPGYTGIAQYTGKNLDDVHCPDCYYISTLTPDQAQTLYNGGSFPNGLPPLSNETMPNGNPANTGFQGKEIPIVGPPLWNAPPQMSPGYGPVPGTGGIMGTGGSAYPLNSAGSGAGESSYVAYLMQDLENKGLLPKGYYYFQGSMGPEHEKMADSPIGNPEVGGVDGNPGQAYYNYPNQQSLDHTINSQASSSPYTNNPYGYNNNSTYPYIDPKSTYYIGGSTYPINGGYIEPTPLPTNCTDAGCTLNITPEWKQGYSFSNGDTNPISGIGVYSNLLASSVMPSRENMSLMQITPPDVARVIPRDQQLNFFAMRTVTSHRVPVSNLVTNPNIGTPMLVSYHGRDQSYGGFANVLYDFDLERLFGLRSIVTPFVGGGAGYLWQRYDDMGPVAAASITGVHGGFAWQGIAGVAFDTGISGLQITAQYRMIGQPGSFYNGSFNYGTEGRHANFDQRFNHQFIVGFRYAFHNQPVHITPPSPSLPAALAAAAAPAPVPARSYLVFFDWNQYALTSRARQIVVEAAHATTYVHTTRINVNGYTDSSAAPGPAGQKYNYALSVKRARSVEAELIRNGVPASEIVIRGYGDTNPLVPTGPNTREPQNRRVEIILHA